MDIKRKTIPWAWRGTETSSTSAPASFSLFAAARTTFWTSSSHIAKPSLTSPILLPFKSLVSWNFKRTTFLFGYRYSLQSKFHHYLFWKVYWFMPLVDLIFWWRNEHKRMLNPLLWLFLPDILSSYGLLNLLHESTVSRTHCRFLVYVVIATGSQQSEPRHDKTNNMSVRPAKTQISLGIRPVWSESSLCAHWVAKDPSLLHADREDWADAQADLSLRWAPTHFVGFVMS